MKSQLIPEMLQSKIDNREKLLSVHLGDDFIVPDLRTEEGQMVFETIPTSLQECITSLNKLVLLRDFLGKISIDFFFNFLKNDRFDEISLCHLFDTLVFQSVLENTHMEWKTITIKMAPIKQPSKKVI